MKCEETHTHTQAHVRAKHLTSSCTDQYDPQFSFISLPCSCYGDVKIVAPVVEDGGREAEFFSLREVRASVHVHGGAFRGATGQMLL